MTIYGVCILLRGSEGLASQAFQSMPTPLNLTYIRPYDCPCFARMPILSLLSTCQPVDLSTCRPVNLSTCRPVNPSSGRHSVWLLLVFLNQGYEIVYEGDEETRPIDENTKMTIESTKPILVSLLLKDRGNSWSTMITIPPVDQYTTQHTFPAMTDFDLVSSIAVARVS